MLLNQTQEKTRIQFEYSPSYSLDSSAEKWLIPIEISRDKEKITVTITEEDIEAVNGRVARYFDSIATNVYRKYLKNDSPHNIIWKKHDVRNNDGYEAICIAKMQWDYHFYRTPRFENEEPLDNFTICGYKFTDTELILKVGFYLRPHTVILPLDRFPELKAIEVDKRRELSTHKHSTVLYYYRIKAKLVLRDAVLFGRGLELQPEKIGQTEFLYGKRSH